MTPDIIAIDTETGGLYPSIHPLLSIAMVPSWTMHPFTVYIEPLAMEVIDADAAAKNGYTHEKWMSRGALPFGLAMLTFHTALTALLHERPNALILAHNAGFDRGFLDEAYRVSDYRPLHPYFWRCSQQLMAQLMDQGLIPHGKLSLDRLGELSGQWPVGGRSAIHEAHQDALACLIGYQWLLSIQARPMQLLRRYLMPNNMLGMIKLDRETEDLLSLASDSDGDMWSSPLPPTNPPASWTPTP